MYTDDFVALVRANKHPWAALNFLKTRFGPADVISILDYTYPRRDPPCVTGYSGFDWYTSSLICNFTSEEQPANGLDGIWIEEARDKYGNITPAHWGQRPATGYIQVLERLLNHGVLIPTRTLDLLLNQNTREIVNPRDWRLFYVS